MHDIEKRKTERACGMVRVWVGRMRGVIEQAGNARDDRGHKAGSRPEVSMTGAGW